MSTTDILINELTWLEEKVSGLSETHVMQFECDSDYLESILLRPSDHPRAIYQQVRSKWSYEPIFVPEVASFFRRQRWVTAVKQVAEDLAKLLATRDNRELVVLHKQLTWVSVGGLFARSRPSAKAALLQSCKILPMETDITGRLYKAVRRSDMSVSREFLERLLEAIGKAIGSSVSGKFVDKQTPETEVSHDAAGRGPEAKRIAELEAQNADLRSALEVVQRELDETRRELDSRLERLETDTIIAFFRELNSPSYGRVIDQMAYIEGYLRRLSARGVELSDELVPVSAAIRLFMKLIRSFGLEPIATCGEHVFVNLQESEQYDYVGSDFHDNAEVKELEIKSPGWRFKDIVVSRPVAYEVNKKKGEPGNSSTDPHIRDEAPSPSAPL